MPQRGSLHLHAMPPRATACPDGSGASQSAAPQAKANAARQRATARPDDSGAPQPLALNSGAVQPATVEEDSTSQNMMPFTIEMDANLTMRWESHGDPGRWPHYKYYVTQPDFSAVFFSDTEEAVSTAFWEFNENKICTFDGEPHFARRVDGNVLYVNAIAKDENWERWKCNVKSMTSACISQIFFIFTPRKPRKCIKCYFQLDGTNEEPMVKYSYNLDVLQKWLGNYNGILLARLVRDGTSDSWKCQRLGAFCKVDTAHGIFRFEQSICEPMQEVYRMKLSEVARGATDSHPWTIPQRSARCCIIS